MEDVTVENDGAGYVVTSPEEHGIAADGKVQGLEIALIHMMRVISHGLQGEEAYQFLARGLRADAENFKRIPGLYAKAAHFQLDSLAGIFSQSPRD